MDGQCPRLDLLFCTSIGNETLRQFGWALRVGFPNPQQITWNKGRTVLTRTHYWYQPEPCWYIRKKNALWFGKAGENSTIWDSPSPKFIKLAPTRRNLIIPRR